MSRKAKVNSFEQEEAKLMGETLDILDIVDVPQNSYNDTAVNETAAIVEEALNKAKPKEEPIVETKPEKEVYLNPLEKRKVIVKFNERNGFVTNKSNPMYGGMHENATRTFCVPVDKKNGYLLPIMTHEEQRAIENILGLEPETMSFLKLENNYWFTSNRKGINKVELGKNDVILDLNNPQDWIKYKILLANNTQVCTAEEFDTKNTIQIEYVLYSKEEELKKSKSKMTDLMMAVKLFGKIEDDKPKLAYVLSIMDKEKIEYTTAIDFMQVRVSELLNNEPRKFIDIVTDNLFNAKVMIMQALRAHVVTKRNDLFYYKDEPMCYPGQKSTIDNAAQYISDSNNFEIFVEMDEKVTKAYEKVANK